jgi:hypothetical protein
MQPPFPPFKQFPVGASMSEHPHQGRFSQPPAHRPRLIRLLPFAASFIFLSAPLPSAQAKEPAPHTKTIRWSYEVLFGSEFQNSWKGCRRWVFSPTLSAYSPNPAHHALTREIVTHLNQVLADSPVRHIRLLPPNDYRANIKVHFAPLSHFPKLSKEADFKVVDDNLGFFWLSWNKRNQIIRSTVLLASDKLEGDALRHFAYEEITQSLGIPNDSQLFRDSIFYAGDFKKGDPTTLTERDTRLIQLLYNHLTPGDSPKQIANTVSTFWQKSP